MTRHRLACDTIQVTRPGRVGRCPVAIVSSRGAASHHASVTRRNSISVCHALPRRASSEVRASNHHACRPRRRHQPCHAPAGRTHTHSTHTSHTTQDTRTRVRARKARDARTRQEDEEEEDDDDDDDKEEELSTRCSNDSDPPPRTPRATRGPRGGGDAQEARGIAHGAIAAPAPQPSLLSHSSSAIAPQP